MSNKFIAALLLLTVQQTPSFGQNAPANPVVRIVRDEAPRYTRSHIDVKAASDEELIILTDHPNSTVRVDAFRALATREHPACFDILLKHLTDTDEIGVEGGCFAASAMVGDAMIDLYAPYLKKPAGIDQKLVLDSMLLYTRTDGRPVLRSRDQLLLTLQPQEQFYSRIRTIAIEEKDINAQVALAKYRRPADKPFFISLLKDGTKELPTTLYALSYFADADFLPYLERMYKIT